MVDRKDVDEIVEDLTVVFCSKKGYVIGVDDRKVNVAFEIDVTFLDPGRHVFHIGPGLEGGLEWDRPFVIKAG